jgi:hypothetical protein
MYGSRNLSGDKKYDICNPLVVASRLVLSSRQRPPDWRKQNEATVLDNISLTTIKAPTGRNIIAVGIAHRKTPQKHPFRTPSPKLVKKRL